MAATSCEIGIYLNDQLSARLFQEHSTSFNLPGGPVNVRLRLLPGQALAGCNCTEDGMVIGEAEDGEDRPGQRYVVDSWFVDNGEPAVVLPLAEWLKGGGPNVQ